MRTNTKLNQYQLDNLELVKVRQPEIFGWHFINSIGYRCVLCGREVSPGAVIFFDYDVTILKCRACCPRVRARQNYGQ